MRVVMEAGGERSQDVKESDKNERESSPKAAVTEAAEAVADERKPSAVEAISAEAQKRQWLSWECFKNCPITNPAPPFGRPTPVSHNEVPSKYSSCCLNFLMHEISLLMTSSYLDDTI